MSSRGVLCVAFRPSRKRPGWIHVGVACRRSTTAHTFSAAVCEHLAELIALDHHRECCGCDQASIRAAIAAERRN